MTVNELTEILKAKGYKMASYILWSYNLFNDVIYTDYVKNEKLAMSIKRVKGAGETQVVFISKHFKEELKEIGIELGTILK